MNFAHLHVHTEYSLLDGSNKIKEYVARVKELGMTAAAITDHGVMYGVIDFYRAARAAGINPVLGCEVYVAPSDKVSFYRMQILHRSSASALRSSLLYLHSDPDNQHHQILSNLTFQFPWKSFS